MDLVTGALGMLPSKLFELLKEEYKLQKGVRVQVQSLSRELESMHAALRKVAAVPWDQLDEQVKVWAREVREASYDMEDILDTFLVRVDSKEQADPSRLKRAMNKMGDLFRKGKARHEISSAIEDIRKQLEEVAERRARYRVDDLVTKSAVITSIDPRLSALYTKVSELVGIQEPRDMVVKMLTADEELETKMVSIVGFGGLGKTTLAKAVYENLTKDIYFKAFIPVGQNPDLNKVLKDILIGLDKNKYTTKFNLTILDQRQLVDELRELLKDKRYFIVIDDIWDVPSWNIIRCALDNNILGSKIIVTTRKHEVAEKVGCSYKMEPLPHESSKVLFYGRIFGSEDKCPKEFVELSEKIIKKCGGVPLAIITTSGLLANKLGGIKDWYEYCASIGSGLESNPDMENMRKILSLSYYDLPAYLKTCLLYLSVYPEDFAIDKDRLIWRWIAEDFVTPREGGPSLFELGESYFNDLVNRSLIQPAYMDEEGMPTACRVHDMVLDLICSISREECFVATILGDPKLTTSSSGSKVRRISLQSTTWPTMEMPKLRSFAIFSRAKINSASFFSCHLLLRILNLEGSNLKDLPSLNFVGKLSHLRYLGLRYTGYAGELPSEIGKLQLLQTLDLYGTEIKELPSSIVRLRRLMCLCLNDIICLPSGLRYLTSLEVLRCAIVDSAHIAEELSHLTQLSILDVELLDKEAGYDEHICKALVQSLGKLQKMRDLSVISKYGVVMNLEGLVESSPGSQSLGLMELPTWINRGSVLLLSSLYIKLAQVRREDIHVLGMLQALRFLEVTVSGNDMEVLGKFTVGLDAFPSARVCRFCRFQTAPSMFPRGAVPRLEELYFYLQPQDFSQGEFTTDDLSLDHLPSLRSVCFGLYGGEQWGDENIDEAVEWEDKTEEKLSQEVNVHPNHPSFRLLAWTIES